MKRNVNMFKKLLSLVLCGVLLMTYLPGLSLTALAADGNSAPYYERVTDANTMNNWTKYFDLNDLNTVNAGGVWTDKSVFTDASAFNDKITMRDDGRNFLTALSAIAANKEIVGYSTIPTDTVLVLDLSGSMDGNESALVNAANNAIHELLSVNENNRVGVVLYSASGSLGSSKYEDSVTRLLPIDRYTTDTDNRYISLRNNTVSVDGDVVGAKTPDSALNSSKSFNGGTYIQSGLWEAKKMFEEMDTVIGDNNWQSGDNRMPILVLMSDGAASTGTSYYDDVENSKYTTWQRVGNNGPGGNNRWEQVEVVGSNVGNGNENGLTAGNAFLTQLTASYVMNSVENHYRKIDPNVRGLFYTLGFNISGNDVATSVMNPDSSTLTDNLWTAYNALTDGSLSVNVKNTNSSTSYSDVTVTKNSYVTNKSYVDRYFSASGNGLTSAFREIVEEIILQSRYYPTHLEGGNPEFSGYVEFTDTIGEYMEVKHIHGILLGDTLFDGHMMASKLADAQDGLGTPEDPTDLGNEFIWSVKTRLGITDTNEAQMLVQNAWNDGQLAYNARTGAYSNYIAWYAKADGTYAGFWDQDNPATPGADAVYKIKSYGFLGETTGSIKNSDMMYMTVQVRTDIATGEQAVIWKIPAALVPMITYKITLEGANVDEARNVTVDVESPDTPIRLIFESGLRSDLNELNISRITDAEHIAADGVTRRFWTNYFDISAASHDDHVTAVSEFTPSKENERFYYTFDSAVHKQTGGAATESTADDTFALVGQGETLDPNGTYFHRRYIFIEGQSTPQFYYEKMSKASVAVAIAHGWDSTFITKDNTVGAYIVPAGTPARELQMYDEQKAANPTESARMVFHPYLTEQNNIFYVDMNLGNNGRLLVTPAQGLKLSKTVDIFESGTSTDFTFRITIHNANGTPYTGTANSWITDLDVVPLGAPTVIDLPASGVYTVDLSKDQTLWLTDLPTGATYTVEEISANADYKIRSVHVNGSSQGTVASGVIAANFIDDVDFVNTAIGEGDLVITKQVVDANGHAVDVSDSILFTAQVTLTNAAGDPVSGTFDASNDAGSITVGADGKFTVALTDAVSFVVRNIPEETHYTVRETNIPAGFTFDASRSSLTGIVDASANDQALIVNTYTPVGTDGRNVNVEVTKAITGNRTMWLAGESYAFTVNRLSVTGAATPIATFTIDVNDADKKYELDLSGEDYLTAGTYHYSIVETVGTQGGVTYDTAERRFAVVVADTDTDGDLEIVSVNNEINTIVTAAGNTYTVAAVFSNIYQPTGSATATIDILKKMSGDTRLNGFQFALYDGQDLATANEIVRSTVTDSEGRARISLTYAANRATMAGETYTYYLAELNTGNPNITYDTNLYRVDITVKDNGDGTISATPVVSGLAAGETVPSFTNVYTPSASAFVTLTANKEIVGDRVLNANEFEFIIEAITAGAPMPANAAVKNMAGGAVVFGDIEFDTVGTYQYKIYESKANPIGGFAYDERFYEVTVVVTDNGNATLSAAVTRVVKANDNDPGRTLGANELITFTNTYDATDATVTLSGQKILTGKTLQNGEFTFVLTPTDASYPMPSANRETNDASGKFTFGTITYDKAGVYTYTLTEQATADPRYDFDKSVYTVTVTVTDNSRGVLSAQVALTKNGLASTEVIFRNGFVPTPLTFDISAVFGGQKVLDGRPLEEGEFEFALINAINGKQISKTVKNDATGAFAFPAVTLPAAGIYHYKITEIIGDEKGVSYDTSSFHVRLEVVQDDHGVLNFVDDPATAIHEGQQLYKGTVTKETVGGVLTEVTDYKNITDTGSIVFTNTYNADPAHVTITATKTLTGRDLRDGEFKFDLYQTGANYDHTGLTPVQDDVVLSLNADGTGTVTFMSMTYDAEGTYHYVVVEDEAKEFGITPDTTAHKIEITVTDNHNGDLIAAIRVNGHSVTGSTGEKVLFENTYDAEATDILIAGKKVLNGRDLVDGEFTFALYENGDEIDTAVNKADGTFTFDDIEVDREGRFVYTVKEIKGDKQHVTYDETVYTVTVTVTDNGDGTYKVEYAYAAGTQSADGMVFTNVYAEPLPPIPSTGDRADLPILIALLFVSAVGFGTAYYLKKRKES